MSTQGYRGGLAEAAPRTVVAKLRLDFPSPASRRGRPDAFCADHWSAAGNRVAEEVATLAGGDTDVLMTSIGWFIDADAKPVAAELVVVCAGSASAGWASASVPPTGVVGGRCPYR